MRFALTVLIVLSSSCDGSSEHRSRPSADDDSQSGDPDGDSGTPADTDGGGDDAISGDFDITNSPPIAVAEAQPQVPVGALAMLDGTASHDPDSDTLSFSWTQTAGPDVTLSDASSAQPTFVAPAMSTDLAFALVVSDGALSSGPSPVAVAVTNSAPVANAGLDQIVLQHSVTVFLDGSASTDPEGLPLSFLWDQTAGVSATLDDETAAVPSFVAYAPGTYEFELVVGDGEYESAPDTITVDVPNGDPLPGGGPDRTVLANRLVILDGWRSTDPNQDYLQYSWTQIGGPVVDLHMSRSDTPLASFVAPADPSTLVFDLYANDSWGGSGSDSVSLEVLPGPADFARRPFHPGLLTPGEAWDVEVAGDYAFVACPGAGVLVVDVSNPAAPIEVARIDDGLSIYSYNLALHGSTLFFGAYYEMSAVDISVPSNPGPRNAFYLGVGYNAQLAVAGDLVLAADADTVYVFDVATTPGLVTTVAIPEPQWPVLLTAEGDFAYVSAGDNVWAIDLGEPSVPLVTPLGSFATTNVAGLQAVGDRLFVARGSEGVAVWDISSRTAPTPVGVAKTSAATDMKLVGDTLFVADNSHGVVALDVSPLGDPVVTGIYPSTGTAIALAVSPTHIFTAEVSAGLQVTALAGPARPEVAGTYDLPDFDWGVTVSGDFAFVANDANGLAVLDISDPSDISTVGSQALPSRSVRVAVSGATAFVAAYEMGLQVLDVTDPTDPTTIGSLDTDGNALDVEVQGDVAFVADWDSGLVLVDVSTPEAPVLRSSVAIPRAVQVALAPPLALVAADWGGLVVVDIGDLDAPDVVGALDLDGNARQVVVIGDHAFVALYPYGVASVDISTPDSPVLDDYLVTFGAPFDLQAEGNRLFVAGTYQGVEVLDASEPNVLRREALLGTPYAAYYATHVGQRVYVTDWAFGLQVVDVPALPSLDNDFGAVTAGQLLSYQVSWDELYAANDEDVACFVSGGNCSVSNVDSVLRTADVSWTVPLLSGAHELAVAVGNPDYLVIARDGISVP